MYSGFLYFVSSVGNRVHLTINSMFAHFANQSTNQPTNRRSPIGIGHRYGNQTTLLGQSDQTGRGLDPLRRHCRRYPEPQCRTRGSCHSLSHRPACLGLLPGRPSVVEGRPERAGKISPIHRQRTLQCGYSSCLLHGTGDLSLYGSRSW